MKKNNLDLESKIKLGLKNEMPKKSKLKNTMIKGIEGILYGGFITVGMGACGVSAGAEVGFYLSILDVMAKTPQYPDPVSNILKHTAGVAVLGGGLGVGLGVLSCLTFSAGYIGVSTYKYFKKK